jgi:hypothetical protein
MNERKYRSYPEAFESERLNIATNIAFFLNTHWIGITVSVIGVLLGVTSLRLFREE